MMADLGAEVIKVELPVEGDDTRRLANSIQGYSTQFMWNNRGKKSITVDLKDPDGAAAILELGKTCDIVFETMKPGSMKKMGLDYEAFKAVKPDIIYCSISAFGQTGPKAKDPGFDILAQACSGIMDMTGERNGPPVKSGVIISDFISGKNPFLEQATNGKDPHRQGNHSAGSAPYGVFKGPKDEYLVIAAHPDRHFAKLCTQVLERPELVDDPRFVGGQNRANHYRELADIIEEWMSKFDSVDECKAIMDKAGIVCGKILSCKQVIEDPQMLFRKGITDLPMPADREGTWRGRGATVLYSATPEVLGAAPVLGANNYEILTQAGLSREQVYELETRWGQPIEKP